MVEAENLLSAAHRKLGSISSLAQLELSAERPDSARSTPPLAPATDDVGAKKRQKLRLPRADGPTEVLLDEVLEGHAHPDGRRHAECPQRLAVIADALRDAGLLARCGARRCEAEASEEELGRVHSPFYLKRMRALRTAGAQRLADEASQYDSVFLNHNSDRCARLAAGGVLALAKRVWAGECRNGLALVRPAGHHAGSHGPSGFCLYNSLAVSVKALLAAGAQRLLIVDWDVHHGDGTQQAFLDDPRVLFVSVHRRDVTTFPYGAAAAAGAPTVVGGGAGAGYTVNLAWSEPCMGDAEYAYAWEQLVLPLAQRFEPQMVLVSAGFDAAAGDPIGDCDVSAAGFGRMTRELMEACGGRLLLALEGGYSLAALPACALACARALLGDAATDDELAAAALAPAADAAESARADLRRTIEAHAASWPGLEA